jgi:succinate dehydrogenase / fumarate reductase membrane anchor subunit
VDILSRQAHGVRDWLLQRVTAVYLGCYIVYLMVHFSLQPVHGYEQWHAWLSQPLVAIVSAGSILAILMHGWVGMRDVVLDYVHTVSLRLIVLSLIGLLLAGCGFWALRVLVLATA